MSKFQKQRLSAAKPGGSPEPESAVDTPESVLPLAGGRSRVEASGERFHVVAKQLVDSGLLVFQQAALIADEFRRIKRPLIDNATMNKGLQGDNMNLIATVSPQSGAGKSFCAFNLALSISNERELSVILVDADVAKPHMSTAFGLVERPGLIDILEDDELSIDDVLVPTDLNNIVVLPAGRKHMQSTELLASARMEAVMLELASRYTDRLVVIDSPPLLATSEAQAAVRQAGQIVLVIESGKTTNAEIEEALDLLDPDKAVNAVLNKSVYTQSGGQYGYGYGYGYGYRDGQGGLDREG